MSEQHIMRCPFCTNYDLEGRFSVGREEHRLWVHCRTCGADGPAAESASMAIKRWNAATRWPNDEEAAKAKEFRWYAAFGPKADGAEDMWEDNATWVQK